MSGAVDDPDQTVRDRLIEAADLELTEGGTLTGRFEAVAHRAGVSRATAYRQLGSISELMTQVGLRRARKYMVGMREAMDRQTGALGKLEAAMIYAALVLPDEPLVLRLMARHFSSAVDPEVSALIDDLVRPTLSAGQSSGELRDDIDLDSIIGYLVEQSYLATRASDRSEEAVKRRFRLFIEPTITPPAEPGRVRRA